jgi:hypothetical protein
MHGRVTPAAKQTHPVARQRQETPSNRAGRQATAPGHIPAGPHALTHFLVRLDAAGQYADNLLHFLHGLGTAGEHSAHAAASFTLTLSCGEPRKSRVLLRGSPAIRESLFLRKFARRER